MEIDTNESKLINKSNDLFLKKYEEKINEAVNSLIELRLNSKIEYKKQLKDFFDSVKESALYLEDEKLSKIGQDYGAYIDSNLDINENSHEFFSNILKGTGIVKKHIYEIKTEYRQQVFAHKITSKRIKGDMNKGNILLLDDDRLISAILKDAFESEGYNIKTTEDPYEAIEYILHKDINIALIDVVMPKLNGFEVLEILKQNAVNIPIIFLSGRSMIEYKVRALSRGVDDYITKPFEIKEVIARIERSLGRANIYKDKLTIDKLTGAYNKEYFNDRIKSILSSRDHLKRDYSVSFIDLDDFKSINDNYGHVIGDYALKDFSKFLKDHLDDTDMIFRFGGDEFIVIFVDKKVSNAYLDIENLRKRLDETVFKYNDAKDLIKLSISSGLTHIADNESVEEILDRADKCLYESKKLGKNKTMKSSDLNCI